MLSVKLQIKMNPTYLNKQQMVNSEQIDKFNNSTNSIVKANRNTDEPISDTQFIV